MAGITAREIAKKLNISPSAVSLALNGKPGISEKTRNQVLETAMQLGYTKTEPAGSFHTGKTICFIRYGGAVVKAAEHSSFSSFVLQGVESRATDLGYNTQVRYLNAGQMYNSQTMEFIRQAAGVVFLGTDLTPNQMPEMEYFFAQLDSCPVVIVDNFLLCDRVDCIGNDSLGGARMAGEYLLRQGHKRIGYVKARQRILNFHDREQGIRTAVQNEGLELAAAIEVDVSSDGAFRDFEQWLEEKEELPQALYVENDIIAAAVIRALKHQGYRVPEDVSVIGFDDIPMSEILDPPLTTVRLAKAELGVIAMDHLHHRITKGQVPHRTSDLHTMKTMLSTRIISRHSVKKRIK